MMGSTVMSRSKFSVETDPVPFAVSILSLVNLMQLVVIAFLLVCVAMMVTLQLAQARTHRRETEAKRSGEGQAHIFLLREEWPERAGDKDGGQPLCQGRQLRPAFSSNSTHGERL